MYRVMKRLQLPFWHPVCCTALFYKVGPLLLHTFCQLAVACAECLRSVLFVSLFSATSGHSIAANHMYGQLIVWYSLTQLTLQRHVATSINRRLCTELEQSSVKVIFHMGHAVPCPR